MPQYEAENIEWMLSYTFQRAEINSEGAPSSLQSLVGDQDGNLHLDHPFIAVSSDQLTCDT